MEDIKKKFHYNIPIEEIYNYFNVNPEIGLTPEQAEKSIELNGKNELKKVKKSFWNVIIAPIINLLIIIYLISAIAMAALGEITRTLPIFAILFINAIVAIYNQLKAEKQLKALSALSAAKSTVLRNGKETQMISEKITLGDIIKFNQGDKIPADCRIIEVNNFLVNESSLTGESEPVKKNSNSDPLTERNLPLQDQKNILFLGTFVASGRGTAIVTEIGSNTEIGKINTMLEETSTGEIPLRNKMNNFAKKLAIGVVTLLAISIIYQTILLVNSGFTWLLYRQKLVDSIDLAMKVMPINLPLLTTIVLLTGVIAMADKGVVVKEISRTESLGRVSVVCSDKTGTLTKNEMTVVAIWTPDMEYSVTGLGYNPEGTIKRMGIERLSEKKKNVQLEKLIFSAFLNNNAALKSESVDTAHKRGSARQKDVYSITGLPTEGALIILGKKYSPNIEQRIKPYEFVYEFNFDSSIKRMSKIFQIAGMYQMFTKGATEWILPLCSNYEDKKGFHYLDRDMRDIILNEMKEFASDGYRVLSICSRDLKQDIIPDNWEADNIREVFEKDLTFLGLVVILDPPRDTAAQAVEECRDAGISVVMITGDSISTGKAIAEKVGIYDKDEHIAIEGKDIEYLSDDDFPKTTVYGRVSPTHKQMIIERYQSMDKLVSMTGDGVNDALALSMADCGLSMGIQGTEVAKEAADMVITDDSFSTIVTGIREGRGLFTKIRTIVYFFICISIMEAVLLFSSTFFMPTVLFDFWQLNLLYITSHSFPSLGFTVMSSSEKIMDEKPRDSAEIIEKEIFKLMLSHMLLMGFSIIVAYVICMGGYPISLINQMGNIDYSDISGDFISAAQSKARTMAFVVLFINESVIMPLQIRRINQPLKESVNDIDYIHELPFYLLSIVTLIFLIYSVSVQDFLANIGWNMYFMFLDPLDWLICIALCLPCLIGFEFIRIKLGIIPRWGQTYVKDVSKQKILSEEEAILNFLKKNGSASKKGIVEDLLKLEFTEANINNSIDTLKTLGKIKYFRTKPQGYRNVM
ncbi:MAG: cation-translocating P-type ATPase [Promethearchaeota archaeon]